MESKTHQLTTSFDAAVSGEEKASKVIQWLSEAEDISKKEFAVARVFGAGVLEDNAKAFLHLLLEEKYPHDRLTLELPPQKLQALLCEAFTNTCRYLFTPQSFISEFLSFGTDAVNINEPMLVRLSYFVDYPYFPEMLDEWFAIELQSGNAEIPKAIVQKFLSDVDRSVMKYSTLPEISEYVKPLYEYLGVQVIDRSLLQLLLADKGLTIPPDNAQEEFTAEDISFAIKEAFLDSDLVGPVEELAPIPKYDEFLKELREIGVVLPPPQLANQILAEEKKNLPPIQVFINSKLRKKCIEKIFRSNVREYDRAITMINTIEDYTQAELNLRSLLDMHKIRPDSKTALRLNEALRLRFGFTSPINTF